ncbi:MAG: hypothetical protein Q8P18_04985 [Pseudomonadota bacterium]|nr:hypothetical protein [Pseudomonadota bacterium]
MRSLLLVLTACGSPVSPVEPSSSESDGLSGPRSAAADSDVPDALVDCEGGGDFDTLAEAIAAAESGDLIHVAPCTYMEGVDFDGKALRIVSTAGSADTILNAGGGGAGVRAVLGEGTGTTLEGFTVTNGGSRSEAAVSVDFASLRLVDVVLEDNRGFTTIYGASADVELAGVTLIGNTPSYGIAIYMSRGGLVASDLVLDCDSASTGVYLGHGSGILDRAQINCAGGVASQWEHAVGRIQRSVTEGGVTVLSEDDHYDDYVTISNSVVGGNVSATYGSMVIRNSVIVGSVTFSQVYLATIIEGSVVTDAACAVTADTNDFTIRNNVFWGNGVNACGLLVDPVGTNDNLGVDPMFTDARSGDYSLDTVSPAIDAGPDELDYEDVDGSRNDIGVYGGPLSIGGGW